MKLITLINSLIFCLTASIVIFWLYTKIYRKIEIITVNEENLTYFNWLLYINLTVVILLIITTIIGYYLKTKKVNENESVNKTIGKILSLIDYLNIFYKSYTMIYNFVGPEYVKYIVQLAKFSLKLKRITNVIIIISFIVFPRIIIILTFIIELYLGQFYYYFYTLILLLIPLAFRLIVFMLKDVGPRGLADFKDVVIPSDYTTSPIMLYETDAGVKQCAVVNFTLAPEYSDLDFDDLMYNFYYPCLFIKCHIEKNIAPRINIISKITITVYYLITTLGYCYILYSL